MMQATHRFSSLAFVIGMAGLPVYIHAPKYFVDVYGISLFTMGLIMFILRLIDVFQDPLLGIIASKTTRFGALPIALAVAAMSVGMIMLFVAMTQATDESVPYAFLMRFSASPL